MTDMIKDLFGVNNPVIAMAHLPAIPGTPRYNNQTGVEGIVENVRQDVRALLEGGVDAILF
jgi:predicted TIM-barrel enzyme